MKIRVPKRNEDSYDGTDVYEKFYTDALKELKENLQTQVDDVNKPSKRSKILSLGRKGIKTFECLFHSDDEKVTDQDEDERGKNLKRPDVISEHALPFISRKDRNTNVVYCLMDDALYYGSSAIGVALSVYAFENIYHITGHQDKKINYFAAINTDELRSNFEQHIGHIKAKSTKKEKIEKGYSHFFSKRLSRDIRSLENTFEIEYPIITYTLDKRISEQDWEEKFETVFQGLDAKVYAVEHTENYSINVLLPKTEGSSFNKIRIFPSNSTSARGKREQLKVVSMAPHPIFDNDYDLEHLFDKANEGYKELWKDIFESCYITTSDTNAQNIIDFYQVGRWRTNKSLVIMANYLLSFSNFIQQCKRLEDFFSKVGVKATFKGVDANKDLYFLLGDKDLCIKIAKQLEMFYSDGIECGDTNVNMDLQVDYVVFEDSSKIDRKISLLTQTQDEYLLEVSQNMEEALGALFFNQDVVYEKMVLASNPITQDFNRLRMGYTFEWLQKSIDNALKWNFFRLGLKEDFDITLHRWVDQRIGEASIVPQYILDQKSKYWIRAFRHGENEETLLAHLALFVVLIYEEWRKQTLLEWIKNEIYQDLLAKAYIAIDKKGEQIVESTNIHLYIDEKDELVFINDHYVGDEVGKPHNVLQYMLETSILSEEVKGNITIHKRTKFFLQPGVTTLEKKYEDNIKELVRKEADEFLKQYNIIRKDE